jgi:hypothetical protein
VHRVAGVHLVLNVGPHDGGGGFGPQGELVAAAVGEGVHLLFDDVGVFADAAGEQFGFFHDGHADLAIAEGGNSATAVRSMCCHSAISPGRMSLNPRMS